MTCTCNGGARPLIRKNYKEDFSVTIRLMQNGEDVSFPNSDFTVTFRSSQGGRYECSRTGDIFSNCELPGDGTLVCYLNGHGLSPGTLSAEVAIETEDAKYPDGKRRSLVFPRGGIELVTGASSFDDAEMSTVLNYAIVSAYDLAVKKGYSGTQEAFYSTFSDLSATLMRVSQALTAVNTARAELAAAIARVKDGKSAYQLAVEAGFSGDVVAWLASLKGQPGDKGDPGWLTQVNHGTADTTFTLTPNTMHVWGSVPELRLMIGTPMPGFVSVFAFEFVSPSDTPTSLLLPTPLKWYNDHKPRIEVDMRYQVNIVGDVIMMGGVPV